jgi:predicted RecB family nuclease
MISNQEIESYFYCQLKAQYYSNQIIPELHPISLLHHNIHKSIKTDIVAKWNKSNFNYSEEVDENKRIIIEGFELLIPFIEKKQSTPIYISPTFKISLEQKNIYSFKTLLLQKSLNKTINYYKVIIPNLEVTKHKTKTQLSEVNLKSDIQDKIEITKKRHCQICDFKEVCNKSLLEKNDLRLMPGIKEPEVNKWNEKGYFTIQQLSYKFRPRKRNTQIKTTGRYKFELKALAIRENKTFIVTPPIINLNKVELFVDFESLPDENYIYLIGVVIVTENRIEDKISFWADDKSSEQNIFIDFFNLLKKLNVYSLHHYGNYEIKELKRFNKKFNNIYDNITDRIIHNSVNILKYFYSDVYPPTFSNGLKEIANYTGFNWSNKNASGINSIVWRKKWETTSDQKYKDRLVQYNIEDCIALFKVKMWLSSLNIEKETFTIDNIVKNSHLKFGKGNFQLTTFEQINKTAYFDYQRTKIYIRTNKKKNNINSKKKLKNKIIPNKIIYSERPKNCPKCVFPKIHIQDKYSRYFLDIKFTKNGFKRWVVLLKGNRFKCPNCNFYFIEPKYLKRPRVGENLRIWIIYNYINYNISYPDLSKMIDETFNIEITRSFIANIKNYYANKFQLHYKNILKEIISGNLIHIDETTVQVKRHKGYVWVITNMTQVFYLYRPNRECGFLIDMLQDFKGILISDFYSGYDALECKQQKCLIHLMRDINDLVFQHQNNLELLFIAESFGSLLQKIVATIDKYGLKKRNLNKHKKDVSNFYTSIFNHKFNSKLALKLIKRLSKNQNKLFVFLDYDSIPWNNNNAEFAIKAFALYRKKVNGSYNEKGLKDYILMLSISKSCHYQDINFLDFLKNYKETENYNE